MLVTRPVLQLYVPSGGTVADAGALTAVSSEAADKKGNATLKNFVLLNIALSPKSTTERADLLKRHAESLPSKG